MQVDTISVLLVERDLDARARLRTLLEQEPDITILDECARGSQVFDRIRQHNPDLVFLGVNLPDLNGFEIVERWEDTTRPVFIFVADDAKYASKAYDARVLDYLIKPLALDRFQQALGRARDWIYHQRLLKHSGELLKLLHNTQSTALELPSTVEEVPAPVDRFVLKRGGRLVFLDTAEIDWIEADDVYVRLHTKDKSHLMRARLKHVEQRLDTKRFIRIHRSTIVNMDRIKEVTPHPNGGAVVSLRNGAKLKMSRSYLDRLSSIFI